MLDSRWKTSCHEAGHAVAALELGGRALGVCLLSEGGGLCQNDELDGTRNAFAAAAGPAAERLADEHPVPDVITDQTPVNVDELENLPVFASAPAIACQMARSPKTRRQYDHDDRIIALWAIGGTESAPDCWGRRVEFARQVAAELVERNTAAIVAIAKELFQRSSLSETEIKTLFDGVKS
jgi:hypothetical protein